MASSGARINKQGRDQTHTLTWRAAAKAGQQRDRPHPAARAAERPPTRVSSRTADTASQPMDQALGHNIIVEVNGCENKEMHAVAAQYPSSQAACLPSPRPPAMRGSKKSKGRDWETSPWLQAVQAGALLYKNWGLCSGSKRETSPCKSDED